MNLQRWNRQRERPCNVDEGADVLTRQGRFLPAMHETSDDGLNAEQADRPAQSALCGRAGSTSASETSPR